MNRMSRRFRVEGVALVLVLMIVGTISILMLNIAITVRSQVERAQAVLDRNTAALALRSDESRLAFALLTENWVETPAGVSPDPNRPAWNFIGKPFDFGGGTVTVQDIGGLFVSPQLPRDAADFKVLLERGMGMDAARSSDIATAIEQKMSEPGWVALQSFRDGDVGAFFTPQERDWLEKYVILGPKTFNPLTVPDVLLPVWFQGGALEGIIAARKSDEYDDMAYEALVRPLDEFVRTYPGPRFRVAISRRVGSVELTREALWAVTPYQSEALKVWHQRQRAGSVQ